MGWEHQIAQLIKKPDSGGSGYYLAKVIGVKPTKLSVFNGEIIITEEDMIKTEAFHGLELIPQTSPDRLKIGDRIAVIGQQKFLIIERVV